VVEAGELVVVGRSGCGVCGAVGGVFVGAGKGPVVEAKGTDGQDVVGQGVRVPVGITRHRESHGERWAGLLAWVVDELGFHGTDVPGGIGIGPFGVEGFEV